jgi:tRNA(His) 5'-end guanylyltransferase
MDLGERMKAYEEVFRQRLPIRMPVVIRLDGKAFHTLTRKCEKPFDEKLNTAMRDAVIALLDEVPGRMAYMQSDEISILLIDYNKFESMQWFDGVVQKMASVSASIMGAEFSLRWGSPGYFDGRIFAVPERDIVNYFIWRQQDCTRNAISSAAQSVFSPRELHGKNSPEMIAMLAEKGKPIESFPDKLLRGTIVVRGDSAVAPIFVGSRESFHEKFLKIEEE